MSVDPGARLGPYHVIDKLGEGGMGEVYRARDTRLGREVAIKILPAGVADDRERRARFEREAQTVATLSHPNIVCLFDTGDYNGRLFVVMELLEGETLRDRLARGVQPMRKMLDVALQIARGLSAAHEKGLVHRDLKPANIFLLRDGQVKILDFGLARPAALSEMQATRTADAMTEPGAVMGTVGYMSPEQVRGEAVDARTDLFAFGAVLYEMLSGKRAFQRDTAAETMTAILREDPPDLIATRSDLAPGLDRIVRHCLEKNPVERFQTARDVAFALDALSGSGSGPATLPAAGRRGRAIGRTIGLAAAVVLGVVAGALAMRWYESPAPPIEFARKTFDDSLIGNARFMPDGRTIVYSSSRDGRVPTLYELRESAAIPRRIGRDGTALLAVSKTGELAVMTDVHRRRGSWIIVGTLSSMTLEGSPRPIAPDVSSADWSPDGKDLAIVRFVGGLAQLEYPMGHALYKSAGYISDVRIAPDGKRIAFMDHQIGNDNRGWIRLVDTGGTVTTLGGEFPAEDGLAWSADGRVIFFSIVEGAETSFRICQVAANASGEGASPVIAVGSSESMRVLDASATGAMLAVSQQSRTEVGVKLRGESALRDLTWLDGSWSSSMSTDGSLLLFTHGHGGPNYVTALRRTDGSPIVTLGDGNTLGISPDSRWALAVLMASTPAKLIAYPTGAGSPMTLSPGGIEAYDNAGALWLPDNRMFVFRASEPKRPTRTYLQTLDGGEPRPVLPETAHAALVTPDGAQIVAKEPGQPWRLYPLNGGASTEIRGLKDDDQPAGWSRDGRAIFTSADGAPARLDRVDLSTGARSFVREVHPAGRGIMGVRVRNVTADGEQFVYETSVTMTTLHLLTGVRGVK